MDDGVYVFGPFRANRSRRLLERGGEPVQIGGRAFDLLLYLLENSGRVISHQALTAAVWPNVAVGEMSLRYQITALRKVLGDAKPLYRCVINVAGRGYCFAIPISYEAAGHHGEPADGNSEKPEPLPHPVCDRLSSG